MPQKLTVPPQRKPFAISCVMNLFSSSLISSSSCLSSSFLWASNSIRSLLVSSSFCTGEGNGTPLQSSCLENPMDGGAWWAAVHWVATSRTWLSDFTFTFHFHALEKEMATHSSVLAWRIPGMESHRVGHDWSDLAAAAAAFCTARRSMRSSSCRSSSNFFLRVTKWLKTSVDSLSTSNPWKMMNKLWVKVLPNPNHDDN